MKRFLRTAAVIVMAWLMISAAHAAEAWTAYGRGDHASASGDTVSFEGHPTDPFVSMLYRAAGDGDYRTLTWHLTEGRADWHTVEGAGFVFNCGVTNGGMTGYAVMFGETGVQYYKLSGVSAADMETGHFSSLSGVELIETLPRPAYSSGTTWYLKLTMSPGTVKFEKHADPSFAGSSEILLQDSINDRTGGTGYGPFASFLAHNCDSISRYDMDYFSLTVTPNTPPTVTAPDVTLKRGERFSEMSDVAANDAEDGDLTASVAVTANDVDTGIPGIYSVTYEATDLAGASASHTRKVTVWADALFAVTDGTTGNPVPGVEITVAGQGAKTSGTDGETGVYVLPADTYSWSVTGQHRDYLPLTETHTADITKNGTAAWPMRVPVELTRKTYDVGVALDVGTQAPLRYHDTATFALVLRNDGNVPSVPTVKLTVPEGLTPTDATALVEAEDGGYLYTSGTEILPGTEIAAELMMRVVTIAETGEETVSATLTGLEAEGAAVADGDSTDDSDSASVLVKNPPVILTKTDALTGKPLAGVVIEITDAGGKAVYTGTSDDSGRWTVHGLIPGAYAVVETQGLPGYAKAYAAWKFERDAQLAVTGDTELTNSPLTLEILKTDGYSKKPMEGVVFTIAPKDKPDEPVKVRKQENGEWIAAAGDIAESGAENGTEIATDQDGKIILRYLPAGAYVLAEKTPVGYADTEAVNIKVDPDNGTEKPVKADIANLPTKLVFQKLDALTGTPLRALSVAKYASTTTATSTVIGRTGVIGGGAASGPAAAPTQSAATTSAATTTYTQDGVTADSAVFRLVNAKGEAVKLAVMEGGGLFPSAEGKKQFAVDVNGICDILYLPVGTYTVEEMSAATGYGLAQPVKAEVKAENSTENPAKAQMGDPPLALRILKEKKDGGSLTGAGFSLTVKGADKPLAFTLTDGRYHYDPDGKETVLMVDGKGEALACYLPIAEYTLTETVTPDGYFNAPPTAVRIAVDDTADKPAEITVVNDPEVKLGLDSDRWRVPVAITMIAISLSGLAVLCFLRRKKGRKEAEHGA